MGSGAHGRRVILFVCSGGGADRHPGGHSTPGLAKQILDSSRRRRRLISKWRSGAAVRERLTHYALFN